MLWGSVLLSGVFSVNALDAITLQDRQGGHPIFVDSTGRERLFHGTNAVVKGPPYHPDGRTFSADISMTKEDFEWMQKLGLNVLRLGVLWAGVEPIKGQYNESYLDELDHIVATAAAHGVYTFLDMHQDGLSEYFCGEGVPAWAVRRSEFPGVLGWPFPFAKPLNSSQVYEEPGLSGSPSIPTPHACGTKHGPGWGEGVRETAQAYQAIYSNWKGLGDAFAAMWGKVAKRFANRPEILGLEILNEPFAGDFYEDPLIMVPYPNPHNADAKNLQPIYDRVNAAVRTVDDDVLLFFAGTTWDDLGAGFSAPPGGAAYSNRSVLAYHYYKPPQFSVAMQYEAYNVAARRLHVGAFMTESDHGPGREVEVGDIGDGADAALQSWATWEWKNFFRGADDSRQIAAWGSSKTGHAGEWPGETPSDDFQRGLARTWAPAVAGETQKMAFNLTSSDFLLKYSTRGDSPVPTEIFLWPQRYPGGAQVEVSGGKTRVEYDGKGSQVLVFSDGSAESSMVEVRISRKAESVIV